MTAPYIGKTPRRPRTMQEIADSVRMASQNTGTSGRSMEEIAAEIGFGSPSQVEQKQPITSTKPEVLTQRWRAAAQGATFGFGDEAEAFFRSWSPNQTYEQALKDVRDKLEAYREDRPKEAFAMEMLGGLATGVAGGARSLAATAGRTGAKEVAKVLARKAATGAITQGALSGAGAAEGDLASRAKGAVVGGTVGALLPFGAKLVGKRIAGADVSKQIVEGAGDVYAKATRAIANKLEQINLPKTSTLARYIEPTDVTKIQRAATQELPGGVAGPTTATMQTGVEAASAAVDQARIAAQQGRLTAQQAAATRAKVEQEARNLMRQVRQEEGALGSLASQKAAALRETGAARAQRLVGTAKESGAVAKEIRKAATAESRQAERMVRDKAKEAAESTLREIEEEASGVIGGLRGAQPRGSARQLQESVRAKQLAEGEKHYQAIENFGAPPDPDPEIYREIFSTPSLKNAYNEALQAIRQSARNATPDAPIRRPLRTITIDGNDVPEVTLEVMDEMRRRIVGPQMRKGPDVVGLSRSEKNRAMETIGRLEDRYLAGFGSDEAVNTLKTAREAYREKFQVLEAVQDGLNLGTVKAGRASGLLTQSRKELDEVVKRVSQMTPEQQAAFRVGAREWFDRLAQESPTEALKLTRKFSSEASQRRLALAYGDEAVEALRTFTPKSVMSRTQAAAAQARTDVRSLAEQIAQRGRAEALPLEQRATRAAQLAEAAKAAKISRAEQVLFQREAAATQRIEGTRRAAQEQVGTAREAARSASEQAARLAEELTQAKISQTQAKQLPIRDIDRALGTSKNQQVFLQRLLPQLTSTQRKEAVTIIGSNLQRELQDMARTGASRSAMMQRINTLSQNDVVRTLFAPQMEAFVNQLYPSAAARIPQALRPSISGYIGRQVGSKFNER